jgi:serine protease
MITTTNIGANGPETNSYSNGDKDLSLGTSFSAPLVSGTAALMLSLNPTITPATLKRLLQGSARGFPTTGAETIVTACHAPTSAVQDECYCTTATCGAGLLDTSAAVQAVVAAALPTAKISASATSVITGGSVTLDGSGSTAGGSQSLASYAWSLSNGSAASFSSATNGATATLLSKAAGNEVVTLTVTDSAGTPSSTSVSVAVTAPATPTPTPGGSSDGGGGAIGWAWLLGLLAAVIALYAQSWRRG